MKTCIPRHAPRIFIIPFAISLWTLLVFLAAISLAGLAEAIATGARTGNFRKAWADYRRRPWIPAEGNDRPGLYREAP